MKTVETRTHYELNTSQKGSDRITQTLVNEIENDIQLLQYRSLSLNTIKKMHKDAIMRVTKIKEWLGAYALIDGQQYDCLMQRNYALLGMLQVAINITERYERGK